MIVDFTVLERPATPNSYIICPEGLCPPGVAHATAPVFAVPPAVLLRAYLDVVASEPRTDIIRQDATQVEVVQTTALLRFKDVVTADFLPAGQGGSTIAVFSRSQVGYSDLGVNRKRVGRWLSRLAAQTGAAP